MYLHKWLYILFAFLILLFVYPNNICAKKKNSKYEQKRKKSQEILLVNPDPISHKAMPDIRLEPVRKPSINFKSVRINYTHGFDMSHHQGDVNWKLVAQDPNAGFIFLKATEGSNFVDRLYKYNFKEAKKAGLKVGSYHFFRPNIRGEQQYENFISVVDYKKQDLLPIIDVEVHPSSVSLSTFYSRLERMLELVTKKIGRRPIIYTGKNFYNKYFANGRFKDYPFMIAAYTMDEPVLNNNDDYIIWQYTATGRAKGVRGDVDISRFRGNHSLDEILY